MSSSQQPQTLTALLGITDVDIEEEQLDLKKAAFLRYQEALRGDDLEEQMAAFDGYLDVKDLNDGE